MSRAEDARIIASWGPDRQPLDALARLCEARADQLGESCIGALYATARHVIRSLRPRVKVAKLKKAEKQFTVEDTGWVIGKNNGRFVPHTKFRPDYHHEIHPIIMWGGGIPKHTVHVYKITPKFGKRMTWKKNAHKGCWYVAAFREEVARTTGQRLVERALSKYAGLARASVLAMQLAARKVRQDFSEQFTDNISFAGYPHNVIEAAGMSAYASFTKIGKDASLVMRDKVDYVKSALRGGENDVTIALAKAANSVAGYLRKKSGDLLDPRIQTPYPELSRKHKK